MSGDAKEVCDEYKAFLLGMAEAFQAIGTLRKEEQELRDIAASIDQPFTLAVFGRMKTGKSSIINALIGRELAITGVEETTATLNWISYGDPSQLDSVIVQWRDGTTEPIPRARLHEWTGKSPEALERVRRTAFLKLFDVAPFLKGVQIVDTPGTGSVAEEHEKIAKEFLSPRAAEESQAQGKKADALIYVFSEAKASDQEALDEFRRTRLPGSDPYNSIGVLHLWDNLEVEDVFAEARRKSEKLKKHVGDVISEVIPVSAPLAMVARIAPDSYLQDLLELTLAPSQADVLREAVKREKRWKEDETRRRIYHSYKLPLGSFQLLVPLLLDRGCDSVEEARKVCLEASGFKQLEAALQTRFFKRAALIKQRLNRVKAQRPIELGLMKLDEYVEQIETDLEHFSPLLEAAKNGAHHSWLASKVESCRRQRDDFKSQSKTASSRYGVEKHRMNLIEGDLAFLEAMHHHPEWIEARDQECIRGLLSIEGDGTRTETPSRVVLEAMLKRYAFMTQYPELRTRSHFEHLLLRVQQALYGGHSFNLLTPNRLITCRPTK